MCQEIENFELWWCTTKWHQSCPVIEGLWVSSDAPVGIKHKLSELLNREACFSDSHLKISDFSNSQFFKHPDSSNQKSFVEHCNVTLTALLPFVEHCNVTLNFTNSSIFQFSFSFPWNLEFSIHLSTFFPTNLQANVWKTKLILSRTSNNF